MANKIRIGFIGCGEIAELHLKAIRATDSMEVVGVTSRNKSHGEEFARKHKIEFCAEDIDSLVKKAKPDALMVLVSVDQVFSVTKAAISLGLPLFIEKPAGVSAAENLELADLAKKYSVHTMVGLNRRYYSIFHKGMDIIRQHGLLMGVVVEGHERMWRIRENKRFSDFVMEKWIFANSIHTIDLLRFFGGEAEQVMSIAHRYKETQGDQFSAVMEFESGAIGHYISHWYSPGGWRVVLYGDGVTVEFKPLETGWWTDKNFQTHPIEPDDIDKQLKPGFFAQIQAFGKLIKEGAMGWPLQDLQGSYQSMALAEKLMKNLSDRPLVAAAKN